MKKRTSQIFIIFLILVTATELSAQAENYTPNIKERTYYSFYLDKLETSFDSLDLNEFIKGQLFFNRQGQKIKYISYPFKKKDNLSQIAKVVHYQYNLDTTFMLSKTLAGDLISDQVSLLQADSTRKVYAKIYGDYSDDGVFTKNNKVRIREWTYTKNTAMVDIIEYPLDGRDTVYREGMEDIDSKRVKLSINGIETMNEQFLKSSLYAEIINTDTTQYILENIINIDSSYAIKESFYIENSPEPNKSISKFVTFLKNGLKTSSTQYSYKNQTWEKLNSTNYLYNEFGDETSRITERVNSKNENHKYFVLINKYEYYD